MDDNTNVIEFPAAAQPEAAPAVPFDTVEEMQTAVTWVGQLLADSRAAVAKVPHFGDPVSLLETWIELAQAVIAKGPQHGEGAVLRGLDRLFVAAGHLAGR